MVRPCLSRGPFFRHIISGRSCWILRRTSTARVAIRISRFITLSIRYWRRYILLASRFLHRSNLLNFLLPFSFPFSASRLNSRFLSRTISFAVNIERYRHRPVRELAVQKSFLLSAVQYTTLLSGCDNRLQNAPIRTLCAGGSTT